MKPAGVLLDLVGVVGCERIVSVDYMAGKGAALFEAVRQTAPRASSPSGWQLYRGGPNRDWLKAKVSETAVFVITGYIEREAVAVAELKEGVLVAVGLVKFGLAGKGLWPRLERRHAGPASRADIIPVRPAPVPTRVSSTNPMRSLSLDGVNRSNCPDPVIRQVYVAVRTI